MKRSVLILLLTLSAALGASASEASDSLARALATYWHSAINTSSVPQGQTDSFVAGVADQLSSSPSASSEAYMQGAVLGRNLVESLRQLKEFGIDVTPDQVAPILISFLKGEKPSMSVDEAQAILDRASGIEADPSFTPEAQAAFVADAAAREGAVTTPSGLVFEVITEGEGPMPKADDDVMVNYTGRFSTGEVFDSTDSPLRLHVSQLVPGFTEGLMMMRPGGTYRIVMPASLAYGDTGAGAGTIPPGAALDFTVTLLSIE